jgi:hypothetical protein
VVIAAAGPDAACANAAIAVAIAAAIANVRITGPPARHLVAV